MEDETTPAAPKLSARRERGRRIGRRVSIGVYALVVTGFTAACALQILDIVWFPEPGQEAESCEQGLTDLISGVESARKAAAEETGGERQAMQRFRENLGGGWDRRQSVERLCQGNPKALATLRAVDHLRYAEEHAVRYEATGVAGLRRKVHTLQAELR